MPIKIQCPKCQKLVTIPDNFEGTSGICPACDATVPIPTDGGHLVLRPIEVPVPNVAQSPPQNSIVIGIVVAIAVVIAMVALFTPGLFGTRDSKKNPSPPSKDEFPRQATNANSADSGTAPNLTYIQARSLNELHARHDGPANIPPEEWTEFKKLMFKEGFLGYTDENGQYEYRKDPKELLPLYNSFEVMRAMQERDKNNR